MNPDTAEIVPLDEIPVEWDEDKIIVLDRKRAAVLLSLPIEVRRSVITEDVEGRPTVNWLQVEKELFLLQQDSWASGPGEARKGRNARSKAQRRAQAKMAKKSRRRNR